MRGPLGVGVGVGFPFQAPGDELADGVGLGLGVGVGLGDAVGLALADGEAPGLGFVRSIENLKPPSAATSSSSADGGIGATSSASCWRLCGACWSTEAGVPCGAGSPGGVMLEPMVPEHAVSSKQPSANPQLNRAI